jgi:hypothetical protein
MGNDVLDYINSTREILKNLSTDISSEGAKVGDVRGVLSRLSVKVKHIELNLSGSLQRITAEILSEITAWQHTLEEYLPENMLEKSKCEKLLNDVNSWDGKLNGLLVINRHVGALLPFLELLEQTSRRGGQNWVYVKKHLSVVRTYLLSMKENYPSCTQMQELIQEFEGYFEEIKEKEGVLVQSEADRLAGLCKEWRDEIIAVVEVCSPRPPTPPPRNYALVLEIAGDIFSVDISNPKHLIIGRFDPGYSDPFIGGFAPDGLKILDLDEERILHVFNSVECRWGCSQNDRDCTHREHVEVSVDSQECLIRHMKRALPPEERMPVFYGFSPSERKPLETQTISLKPGERVYLWISGVYKNARTRREQAPLIISFKPGSPRDTKIPKIN